MKINLRKAAAIQAEIKNYLNDLDTKTDIEVPLNIDEAKVIMSDSLNKLNNNVQVAMRLTSILAEIRMNVARANTLSGISDLLTAENSFKNSFKLLESFKNARLVPSDTMLKTAVDKSLATDNNGYYGSRSTTMSVSFVNEDFLNQVKQELTRHKRERTKINESLLALNVQTEIELKESDYEYLVELGVI